MKDYEKPLLRDGKPLRILQAGAHHCIRCIKKARALQKVGYEMHGMGRQLAQTIKRYVIAGIDIIEWNNEPDHPVSWIREILDDMGKSDEVKLVTDLHDLDSIRKDVIPIPERLMFNDSDAFIYAAQPIQEQINLLHQVTKPNTVMYSYCNEGLVNYEPEKIAERKGCVYEGGANPPDDESMNAQYAYRYLYDIFKQIVEMGNELSLYCGNLGAFQTHQNIGAVVYPPTPYDKLMEELIKYKYGIIVFNNEDGTKNQVNYTLTNKAHEYLQAGLPSICCWAPETEKYTQKHGIGFNFEHIDHIGNLEETITQEAYLEVVETIQTKRQDLVMENFIWRLENLYAGLLGLEKKGVPEEIRQLSLFEFGEEDVLSLLK
jgi:hypothetical protein